MENNTRYGVKIEKGGSGHYLGPNVWLAGGATWDGSWMTNQDRHADEKVHSYKTTSGAEKRAAELRANGIGCVVKPITRDRFGCVVGEVPVWYQGGTEA